MIDTAHLMIVGYSKTTVVLSLLPFGNATL